ncbi:MAG: TldD/PmbA family protein [Leptospiraceae bacterium]|nr:TldD/PmbA family protein [Leptospiraceae bacterium]
MNDRHSTKPSPSTTDPVGPNRIARVDAPEIGITCEIEKHLVGLLEKCDYPIEIRYHHKRSRTIAMRRGELSDLSSRLYAGVGIRVIVNGRRGFAATSDLTAIGLEQALRQALELARAAGRHGSKELRLAGKDRLARGTFTLPGFHELNALPLEQKYDLVRTGEERLRNESRSIESASCQYSEIFEEKLILTDDGAHARIQLVRPELRMGAFAGRDGQLKTGRDAIGATGDWQCLFRNRDVNECIRRSVQTAVDLLDAPEAEGGRAKVVLSPAMVGLLSHEAIGHTVEADFVSAGSVAAGKLGQMVASPLVTLADSGHSEFYEGAGGMLPVDDEGVYTERTVIIEQGRLVSYLHNRESAAQFEVAATGNARAWEYDDEPLIRMRNTYIEPGTSTLDDMIAGIDEGFFIDGPEGGQADATGEFMFGASRVRRIKNGKVGPMVQKMTVSGNAFAVLQSVDAVGSDFQWDLGAGYCGKGQPAKVDAGGPYLRCELLLGGAQQ